MPRLTNNEHIEPDKTEPTELIPLHIIRTETVFSRLPIHQVSKRGRVDINILRKNAQGQIELYWKVSPNSEHGDPRLLAYKIDKLIIDRRIDQLGKPLPKIIRLGSLREICRELEVNEGKAVRDVKNALHQNAGAYIKAKLTYKSVHGSFRYFERGFTRYSIVFTGETLENGKKTDSVYVVLHDPYWQVLNDAPYRPLDYDYFKSLKPSAQRWYEIGSYKMYAAIENNHKHAKLLYSEYCTLSAQKRRMTYNDFKRHMYKVHKPHIDSRYIENVSYQRTTDEDGNIDLIMYYVPGERARAQYKKFNEKRKGASQIISESQKFKAALVVQESDSETTTEPIQLIQYFYKKFHGVEKAYPNSKALKQAADLISQHGFNAAKFVVDFTHQQAPKTNFKPELFGGILEFVPHALGIYEQISAEQHERESIQQTELLIKQYESDRDSELENIRCQLDTNALRVLEQKARETLDQAGRNSFGRERLIRLEVDKMLEEEFGIPTFEKWQAINSDRSQGVKV